MKKLISSFVLGATVLAASAVENTLTFTYAGDDFGSWGKGKSETYDVAIRLNDPNLVGKKITAIRAVINANEGIESTSLWLSKELTLDKIDGVKVNVPDTYSTDVEVEKISIGTDGYSCGQLSASLDSPYVLTEEGIYVGYSLTVPSVPKDKVLTAMQKNPLMVSRSSNPESLYLRASKDFLKWVAYNEKLGASAMIYVSIEGDFPEYSVGINDLSGTYSKVEEDFCLKAALLNVGVAPVSKIGYSYSIGGKDFENTLELDSPILTDFVNPTVVEFPIQAVSELGEYSLDLKITSLDGNENLNTATAASAMVTVLPYVPVHRPMLEEFTGTWCGWCPRGFWALETLNELYGDRVVLAAYHDGDVMQAAAFPIDVQGYPSATLNRNGSDEDPYYGKGNNGFAMKDQIVASMATDVPAAIEVEAAWADEAKTSINVKAESTFFVNKANAGYKVGYLLVNNGLSGEGSEWIQTNYFANNSDYIGTDLEVLTTWPSKVPGLVFNDVVVDVSGMKGVEGSVPDEVTFNTPYATDFSFDIAGNSVIQDKDKLYVAAFIINPDGSILNANKVKVSGDNAVSAMEADVLSVEYFNLNGVRVATPGKGVFVKATRLSDGTVRTTKVAR